MYEAFTKLSSPVRLAYASVAIVVWALTLGGRLRRGVVVLCYHNVRPDQAERFGAQVRAVRGRIISLGAIGDASFHGHRPRVVFTFDDAYANLLMTVAPVMERERAYWSVFPVSGVMGETPTWPMPEGHPDLYERTMNREELARFVGDPLVEIGAHTRTHPMLTTLDAETMWSEIAGAREDLRKMLGVLPETIALPHGVFDARVIETAVAAGYQRVLTLEHALEPRIGVERRIARFSASPDNWRIEHRLLVDGAYSWIGVFRSMLARVRGKRR